MTRIYDEAQTDSPIIGTGQEVYAFILRNSRIGKEFIQAVEQKNSVQMCILAVELGLLGYTKEELKSFFGFVFGKKNS